MKSDDGDCDDDGNIVGTGRGYQGQTMVQIDASEVDLEILRERDDALVKLEVSSSLGEGSLSPSSLQLFTCSNHYRQHALITVAIKFQPRSTKINNYAMLGSKSRSIFFSCSPTFPTSTRYSRTSASWSMNREKS